jgi:capsule polysaccharide export protein KpsE/RkpR
LIAIAIISGLAATVFSSSAFIEPKFKSTAVVYPVNIIPYSNESATEQLLQLFQSADVKNKLIEKFDLANHYGIGDNSKEPNSKLILEFNDNVSISKTEFESVNIEILDKDPVKACAMVNEIIIETNLKLRQLQREKSQEMHAMYAQQIEIKKNEIDTLKSQISKLRLDNNFIDIGSQAREVTRGLINAKGGESSRLSNKIQEVGAEYTALNVKLDAALAYYTKIKSNYDDITGDLNKELTYTNVVTKPYVADSKSYPIRWIIVLSSVLASLFLGFIIISISEGKKKNFKQSL